MIFALLAGRLRRRRVERLVSVRRRHRPERAHAPHRHAALVERPRVPDAGRRNGLRRRVRAARVGAVGRVLGVVRRRRAHAAAGGGSFCEEWRRDVRQHRRGGPVQPYCLHRAGAHGFHLLQFYHVNRIAGVCRWSARLRIGPRGHSVTPPPRRRSACASSSLSRRAARRAHC